MLKYLFIVIFSSMSFFVSGDIPQPGNDDFIGPPELPKQGDCDFIGPLEKGIEIPSIEECE